MSKQIKEIIQVENQTYYANKILFKNQANAKNTNF